MDGDRTHDGPCSLCGHSDSAVMIRIRERVPGAAQEVAHICPTCAARLCEQVERLHLWDYVKKSVYARLMKRIGVVSEVSEVGPSRRLTICERTKS
jgi:hypothetical protein